MTTQALPKTQEIANKINFYDSIKRKISKDDFNFRLLKKEVTDLYGKISHADYYDFLGRIAALERNKADITSYYKNAIRLSPNNYAIQYNYVLCLGKAGFVSELFLQTKKLIAAYPNADVLATISANWTLGRFQETTQLLKGLENPTSFYAYEKALKAATICDNANLADDEAQHLCELAFGVLETQKLYFSDAVIEIVEDCVLYTIYVDLPIEEIFEVNWELAGIFADNVEDMRSDVLMFEYSSVAILEEKEKYERLI